MTKNQTSFQKGHVPYNKGKHESEIEKLRISKTMKKLGIKPLCDNPMKSFEQRKRASKRNKELGIKPPIQFGDKNHSKLLNVRRKNSESHKGLHIGNENPNWKGGRKASTARQHARRKREFGFNPLNGTFKNSVGHHLNKVDVLNIPEELHKSIQHKLGNQKSMNEINQKALEWYFEQNITDNRFLIEGDI